MANLNTRKIPKGIKEIRYPTKDIIQEFTSKDYTGTLRLDNETGEFKFDPTLKVLFSGGISSDIKQVGHGFSLLTPLYHDGNIFKPAVASSEDMIGLWIIIAVYDNDRFAIGQVGRFEVKPHGLTPGEYYFVSLVPGQLTLTQPPAISNPMLFVESSTVIHVLSYRPSSIEVSFEDIGITNTDDLPEGTVNLYYTFDRVRNHTDVAINTTKVSFPEAPINSKYYARRNSTWEALPTAIGDMFASVYDSGGQGKNVYNRAYQTGTQLANTISDLDTGVAGTSAVQNNTSKVSFPEAPVDHRIYGRRCGNWVATGFGLDDTDGLPEGIVNLYYTDARVEANSAVILNTAKVSFPEVIDDGKQYVRKRINAALEGTWEEIILLPNDGALSEEIIVTGVGTVGGLTEGTTLVEGKTFTEVMIQMLKQQIPPTYTTPTASLTSTHNSTQEIGATINLTLTGSFNQNDGGPLNQVIYKKVGTPINTDTTLYSVPDTLIVQAGTNNYTIEISYDDGPIKDDNFGDPYPIGQILAGTAIGTRNISGAYRNWYGPHGSVYPTTSAEIRTLGYTYLNSFTLNTGSIATVHIIAVPSTKSLSSVIDADALNANITSNYALDGVLISVDDGGGNPVSYKIYVLTLGVPYSSNHRHNVTIS